MNRSQKEALVSDLKEMFTSSESAFLVNYKGLTVSQVQSFRKQLRESDAFFKVAKARLMKIAAKNVDNADNFAGDFKDQVGLVFAMKETPAAAKTIVEFSKDNENLEVVSAFFESKLVSKQEVSTLASIPSREVLLSQLVSGLNSPVSGLAMSLNAIIEKLAFALQEVAEKKE